MKLTLTSVIALIAMIQADADAVTKIIAKVKAAEDACAAATPPLHGAKRDIAIARAVIGDALDLADTLVDQAAAEGLAL